MPYYVLLTISTTLIVALAGWIWFRARNVSFPLGLALIYYLSLYGAWSVVTDKLGGDSGKHYDYMEAKLFSVALDDNYFYSLILYSVFIVVLEVVLLMIVRPASVQGRPIGQPIQICHRTVLLISSIALLGSYLIVRQGFVNADDLNTPAYELMARGIGEVPPYFTIHQILLRVAAAAAALGAVVYFCGKGARLIRGEAGRWVGLGYALVIGMATWLSFLAGYKSEIFFPGVSGCLFYLVNAGRPRIVRLGVAGGVVLTGMWAVDLFRHVPMSNLVDTILSMQFSDISGVLQFASSSNEAFFAHYSMYGALSYHIPLTYGSSFVSLAVSVVPRIFWPGRLEDIYAYYARQVSSAPDQGYTIHHATGWYLNFGVLGVLTGAALMGWVWGKCYTGYLKASNASGSGWLRIVMILSPWMFVAELPFLVQNGPEVYKSLVVEAFLLPAIVMSVAAHRHYARAAKSSRQPGLKKRLELGATTRARRS